MTNQSQTPTNRRLFGLTAVVLVAVGSMALFVSSTGPLALEDLGLLFAGGAFASAWIAFEHWRTGDLINA